jgi:hypothetical protein
MRKFLHHSACIALLSLIMNQPVVVNGQGCDHMISYWPLEESESGTFKDNIGGHDAVALLSAPSTEIGRVGNAQSFNGTSDFLTVSGHQDFNWAGDHSFSIEMWVRLDSVSTTYNMVFIGRDADNSPVHWWVGAEKNTGRAMFVLIGSDGNISEIIGEVMELGEWYHLVALRDGSSNINKLYINNSLAGADEIAYSVGNFETNATIDIGVMNYNGSTNRFFAPAVIDELAIYDTVLIESAIESHYNNGLSGFVYCVEDIPHFLTLPDSLALVNEPFTYEAIAQGLKTPIVYKLEAGPGRIDPNTGVYTWTPTELNQSGTLITISANGQLEKVEQSFHIFLAEVSDCPDNMISLYRLNETHGTTYSDIAGGNNAEALNAPVPVDGILGGAQLFDGQNDGIVVADGGNFNFPANSSFSFEFWVKSPGGSANNMICIGRRGTTEDQAKSDLFMWIGIEANTGAVAFYLRDSLGNEPEPAGLINGGSIADNNWHYVVAVRDSGTSRSYLYLDGLELAVSDPYEYGSSFGSFNKDPLDIGFLHRANGNPGYFLNGALDEVAIYNRALTSEEINENYNQSLAGMWLCSPGNYAPGFVSIPVQEAWNGEVYTYDILAVDIDDDNSSLILSGEQYPDWLTFTDLGDGAGILTGTPQVENTVQDTVSINVTDGITSITQEFIIIVHPIRENNPPLITSDPDSTAVVGELYSYRLEATDPDGDTIFKSAVSIPGFLLFDTLTGTLEGTPGEEHIGAHNIELKVSDGELEVSQTFTITVSENVGAVRQEEQMIRFYPVPADQLLVLDLMSFDSGMVSIFDLAGKKLIEYVVQPASDRVQIDLTSLEEGMYVIKFHNDQIVDVHPFIISR